MSVVTGDRLAPWLASQTPAVSRGSVFSIAYVTSRALLARCHSPRAFLVSGMTVPEEDAEVGQGSKYCLVAIGRLQVRKGSRPFHLPRGLGAPLLSPCAFSGGWVPRLTLWE